MNEEPKELLTDYEIIVSVSKEWLDKMDDSVVLIRCKDCKYYKENTLVCSRYGLEDDDYCSWAERKEE